MGPFALFFFRVSRVQRLATMAAAVLWLVSPRAFAAAPLCDPSGASMVAPPPALPSVTGDLVAPRPCDDLGHDWVDNVHPAREMPKAQRSVEPPDRVVVVPVALPDQKGVKLPRPDATRSPALPGFSASVYRPPRA
jgi:hypothetical protein